MLQQITAIEVGETDVPNGWRDSAPSEPNPGGPAGFLAAVRSKRFDMTCLGLYLDRETARGGWLKGGLSGAPVRPGSSFVWDPDIRTKSTPQKIVKKQ